MSLLILRRRTRSISVADTLAAALAVIMMLLALPLTPALARTVHDLVTPSGIRLWLVEERSIPLVAMRFAFGGGSTRDPSGKEGMAAFLAAMLPEGAGDLDATAFARRLADEGAQLNFDAARDQIYGGLDVISKRLPEAAALLKLALMKPRFDAEAVDRVRTQRVADLEISSNDPKTIAFNRWYAESFPDHPYGRPVNGTPTSLGRITREDAVAAHKSLIVQMALRVVIVGDIDRSGAIETVESVFGALPPGERSAATDRIVPRRLAAEVVVAKEQPLATAAFGTEGVPVDHADFPALLVLKQIVGSGDFDSTLMEEIRVKRGLAYSVSLSLLNDQTASIVLGGMGTKNENMTAALGVLREVLARIAKEGPGEAQFENAKRYLTGSYLLDFDTNAKLAGSLLRLLLDRRRPEYIEQRNRLIEKVTLADVRRVAARVLDPARLNVTVVGKLASQR